MKDTRYLIAEYAMLLNQFGPNSTEEINYVNMNKDNKDFVELAKISKILKEKLGNGKR